MSKKFKVNDGDAALVATLVSEFQGPTEGFINEASDGLFNRPDRMGSVIAHALMFLAWQYASSGKSAAGGVPSPKRFAKFADHVAENDAQQGRTPWMMDSNGVKK